jgi:hypothetical protein
MEFIDIPTEQTTAVTDIILGIGALVLAIYIFQLGTKTDGTKRKIWAGTFFLLSVASIIGAFAHGFQMSERANTILWHPLSLALAFTVALFAAGVVYDLKHYSLPKWVLPAFLGTSVAFFLISLLIPGTFLIFILYEAVALLFALTTYIILSIKGAVKGAFVMTSGILVTIIAAALQATGSIRFTLIWEFDHNGVFHVAQLIALVFFLVGLQKDLCRRNR